MTAISSTAPRSARYAGTAARVVMAGVGLAIAGYASWRLLSLLGVTTAVTVVYFVGLLMVVWEALTASLERAVVATPDERVELARLRVVALVPAYNEDEAALRDCLDSMLRQTRRLDAVCVTDDGSTSGDYAPVRAWFEKAAAELGIVAHWVRTPNGGKRHAQMTGVDAEPDADIYLTVDSDTVLDADAVHNALPPFTDARVQSVAGVILVSNYGTNLLTRMQELWFVALQMVSRGAMSRMGSVMVNSGGCAFYRGDVLRDNQETYLGETLLGREMHASDDSLLTLFALRRGRTVAQPDVFAFTLMPTTMSHHRRQQLRWMRGSTIRAAWRARYLPVGRFAWWYHTLRWMQYGAVTAVMVALVVTGAIFQAAILWQSLVILVAAQLVLTSPYLTLRRSDQSRAQRFAVYATAPLVGLWQATFLRALRWYAILTARKAAVGWGTRGTIEITADPDRSAP